MRRCKNGARNILFVWVGADSTPDVRAALSIQCVKVSGNDVAADHVQVSQGSEPPLLSAICMAKLGHPLCVVSGLSAGDPAESGSPLEVFLEVSMTHLGLEGHCASAYQLEDGSRELRIEGARVRLQVDLQKWTCVSGVTVQSGSPVEVVQGARSIAKIGSQIAAIVLGDRLPMRAELQLVLEEEVGGSESCVFQTLDAIMIVIPVVTGSSSSGVFRWCAATKIRSSWACQDLSGCSEYVTGFTIRPVHSP